jgi:hypothetical protein
LAFELGHLIFGVESKAEVQRPKTKGQPSRKKIVLKSPFGGVNPTRNKKSPGTVKKSGTAALTKVKPM